MLSTEFVLSIVLYLIQWRLARAQEEICEPRASCKESWYCREDGINSCFPRSGAAPFQQINYDEGDETIYEQGASTFTISSIIGALVQKIPPIFYWKIWHWIWSPSTPDILNS